MKLSKLTFKTERVDIEQGSGLGKYLAFYFYIDGKEIGKEEYNPADYDDILASDKDMIFIQHCGCGIRECSALVANVKSVSTDVVEWSINEYRYDAGAEIYHFAKAEYEKTMAQVYNEAYLEGVEQNSSRYASILKMEKGPWSSTELSMKLKRIPLSRSAHGRSQILPLWNRRCR